MTLPPCPGIERRQAIRYPDGHSTYYFTQLGRCFESKIIDISTGGVKISTAAELPATPRGELLMTLKGKTVYMPLKISWIKKCPASYEYGAQFITSAPYHKTLIEKYINSTLKKKLHEGKTWL